jgi:hypothetical protein
VDRDSGQGSRARGQRRGQGLALAGGHLRHHPVEQHPAADDLHVEVTLAQAPLCHLANQREGLPGQLRGEPAGSELAAQTRNLPGQLVVPHGLERIAGAVDVPDDS